VITRSAAVAPTRDPRTGLRTSATFATLLTVLGHTLFGFEQPFAAVLVAVGTAHACALLFEAVDARAHGRAPGFAGGGWRKTVDWLLSAHMTGITLSFLIYAGTHLAVIAFMVAVAIGSKYALRVRVDGRLRHFMNPSNTGIAVGLALFHWTGALPWGFTTELRGIADWALPAVIALLGLRLNLMFTSRLPLVGAWLVGFGLQAVARSALLGNPLLAELLPLTGVPLVLFTLYMITDPMTSPRGLRGQIAFGLGIAAAYGVLMALRINFALFYSVTVATAVRGAWLYLVAAGLPRISARAVSAPSVVSGTSVQ
jgi:enediyne biosynthesis protein E5